jgi:anti-sigma-K factor RskA
MTDREDIDMLAAEFVLGSLDASERAAVEARRMRESDLDAAISDWERRLSPLNERVDSAAPNPAVFNRLYARISSQQHGEQGAAGNDGEVVQLRNRLSRWRTAAIAATAIAASLAIVITSGIAIRSGGDQQFVAVFNEGDRSPAFILSVDLTTRRLTIRPVGAELPPEKSYELWIVAEELGPSPRSLGLLDSASQPTRKELETLDADLLQNATFGISLEPEGGSPTGSPTGPAIHGKLIPAAS